MIAFFNLIQDFVFQVSRSVLPTDGWPPGAGEACLSLSFLPQPA